MKVLASIVDISERNKNEKEVAQYSIKLERSNKALNDFAYIASHDLKAPLRGIRQIADFMVEELGSSASENMQKYFE